MTRDMYDPRLQRCKCGYSFIPSTFMKVIMLVKGEYVKTCPRCQSRMRLKMIHHIVKVDTVSIKNRDEMWKNG